MVGCIAINFLEKLLQHFCRPAFIFCLCNNFGYIALPVLLAARVSSLLDIERVMFRFHETRFVSNCPGSKEFF